MNSNTRRFNLLEQLYATPVGSAYYFEWPQTQAQTTTAPAGYESIWAKL